MKKDTILLGAIVVIFAILLISVNIPSAPPIDEFVDDYPTDYGAVGIWNFEEGTGTTAFDQSSYGNDGYISGATWAAGKYGEALSFDGNDYVNVTDSASLNISDYITIEAWGKDPPFVAQVAQGPVWEPNTIATVGEEIDWSAFWQTFKQYTLWDLEWYDGSGWVSVKEDLDVQLSYPEPNERKVNLVFDASHAGNYRLTFDINKVVRDYVTKIDKYQYELTYDDIQITFDWSDCKDVAGLQFTHGVKDGYFWFRIRRDNVPLGAHVEIDPATVATSTTAYAVGWGFQRKGFYAAGLFWAFYSNGTNAGWEFSNDGTTWAGAFTSIGACIAGYDFSVWFDGTYVHYARHDNYDLFYRRGTPENDGTITWSAVEQTVHDGSAADEYLQPSIAVDTNGYAWIGAQKQDPAPWFKPYVLKNANLDGTWATDFAYELNAVSSSYWRVTPVPLTGGKVYVVYCRQGQPPLGKLYDAGWGAEENTVTDYNIAFAYLFSAVALGDNVHFVYTKHPATYQIRYNERVWGVGWNAADVLVQDAVTIETGPTLSVDPSANELYCFWTLSYEEDPASHVFYKKYSAGSWDADPTDWIDESTDDIEFDYTTSSFYMDYGEYIGLLYITKLESPYNVRFAFLTMAISPNPTNDACDSTPEFPDDAHRWVNVTVSDPQGVATLATVDIQVNTTGDAETFTLRWTQATGIFSEVVDTGNICTLDAATSTRVNIDADTDRICFYFKITDGTVGYCDVKATSTDDDTNTDVDTYSNEFEYILVPIHKVIVEKIDAYSLYITKTNILYAQINSTRISYTVPTITEWHYYSMTYDTVTLKLYLDGELVNSAALTGSIALNNNNVTIGTRFLGPIDQVRIYSVAKTVGEIRNHYINSGGMYSGSVIVSDDFKILGTDLVEDLTVGDGNLNVTGTGEFGGNVDMNLNYILYSINEKALHFDTVGGATRDHVSHLEVGSTTQDRRIMKLIVCVSPAPGVDKWVNISVSDGTNFMWMNITGATEDDYTTTGAFDLDVSAETLEILHDQTAGGASVHVNVILQWYYKENE